MSVSNGGYLRNKHAVRIKLDIHLHVYCYICQFLYLFSLTFLQLM